VKGCLAPLLDAKKRKVYSCIYRNVSGKPERETGYLLMDIETLLASIQEETFLFGDGIINYRKNLDGCPFVRYEADTDWFPRAVNIGKLGYERSSAGTDDLDTLEPLYLHAKECNITVKHK
jgi:tRNA threonylcarbamoyladenosine biosynthesis protein TsaB